MNSGSWSKTTSLLVIQMRHFDLTNRHEIKDATHGTVATVLSSDWETFSELSRYGFQLIDMSSRIWTMRRDA